MNSFRWSLDTAPHVRRSCWPSSGRYSDAKIACSDLSGCSTTPYDNAPSDDFVGSSAAPARSAEASPPSAGAPRLADASMTLVFAK